MPRPTPEDWLLRERRLVGDRIRALREAKELSQEKLAELSGLSRKTISRMENGVQSSDLDQLNRVARGLQVGTWRLFYG